MLAELINTENLSNSDLKIIKARISGPSFVDLSDDDKTIGVDQIMLRVASICGCALPNTEFFAKFIAEEISIFISEFGYQELTLEEIFLAFRLNAKEKDRIMFTGNCVNVDYISKVLDRYMEFRKTLESKLKNKIDGYEL